MKSIFTYIFLFFVLNIFYACKKDSYAINTVQVHSGEGYKLHDIKKIGDTYVTCGGDRYLYSKVLKSQDAGYTWTEMPQALDKAMFQITLVDENIYYGACLDGKLLKTTDGGTTWQVHQSIWRHAYAIAHSGADTIVACGAWNTNMGVIFRSYDGLNQIDFDSTYNHDMRSVWMLDNNTVLIGGYGIFLRSTDAGRTWDVIEDLKNTFFTSIFFVNRKEGYAAGYEGNVFKTLDAGLTWKKVLDGNHFLQKRIHINQMSFYDENHGIAACNEGYILYTSDAGKNWREMQAFDKYDINGIYLDSYKNGVAVTDEGGIYLFEILL